MHRSDAVAPIGNRLYRGLPIRATSRSRFIESRHLKEFDVYWVQEPISPHGRAVLPRSPDVTVARQRHPT
ncbi:MAG: hypothetical protein O2960_29720 [Verrucomicrobia bacterium]|nr:hypothetical protein [Verrucomicrobiota bacterium]